MKVPLLQQLLTFCLLITIGCNTIPDSINQSGSWLIQHKVKKNYKVDSVFVFNRAKGYVVDFYGIHTCTLTVKDSVFSETDSIYRRITCLGDTILVMPDSTYGGVEFQKADVISWDSLFSRVKTEIDVIGKIIAEYLNPDDLTAIQSCQSFKDLTDSHKTSMITTLNEIVKIDDLYSRYRIDIDIDIFFLGVIDNLHKDVNRMVERNIFLDTIGTVNPNLTFFQQEELKWFNWRIFTQYLDNDIIAVDYGKQFKKYPSAGRIYTMLFQQGPSQNKLSENEIIRFIVVRSTGMYQIAYQDEYGLQIPSDKKISNYPYMCDTSWTPSPFLWWPEVPFIPGKNISSLLDPGKATLKYTSFFTDDVDSLWYYDMKFYYPLFGTQLQNGKPAHIAGIVDITFSFYKSTIYMDTSLVKDQGYFTDWNTEIEIQAIDVDEDLYKYKEKYIMKSNDGT